MLVTIGSVASWVRSVTWEVMPVRVTNWSSLSVAGIQLLVVGAKWTNRANSYEHLDVHTVHTHSPLELWQSLKTHSQPFVKVYVFVKIATQSGYIISVCVYPGESQATVCSVRSCRFYMRLRGYSSTYHQHLTDCFRNIKQRSNKSLQ